MLPLIAGLTLLQGPPQDVISRMLYYGDPKDPKTRLGVLVRDKRLDEIKYSPKKFGEPPVPYEFEWIVAGYARPSEPPGGQFLLKFRVYSQAKKTHDELAQKATRTLLQLWDYNYRTYKIDHSADLNNRIVDLYLTYSSPLTGGEQLIDWDTEMGRQRKVNTMYIYDTMNLKDPMEALREVCHEYGHASLWPVGGFKTPEDWGNGRLGELLYIRNLRNELAAGRIATTDVFDLKLDQLDAWLKTNLDPLVEDVARHGPPPALTGDGQGAMDAFAGTALYLERLLPTPLFMKIMKLGVGTKTYDKIVSNAADQVGGADSVALNVDDSLKTKPFWIPTGSSRPTNCEVLQRKQGWAQVRLLNGSITLKRS